MDPPADADLPPAGDVPAPAAPSAEALRVAFEHAPAGMAVLTGAGVVTAANSALGELLQRPPEQLAGRTLFDVTHPDDLAAARDACAAVTSGSARLVRHECRLLRADGTPVWVLVSTSRPAGTAGQPPYLVMHVQDIEDGKAREAELVHRALHDPLTGLPHRTLLLDRVEHALARSSRDGARTCLLYLDLDGFKAVNDTHGHAAGDELLQQLAGRITRLLRPGDTAARLGGDEFAVLCEDTDSAAAAQVAGRLRAAAAEPFRLGAETVVLRAAVGVAVVGPGEPATPPVTDARSLLRLADQRMYEAKRAARGPRPSA